MSEIKKAIEKARKEKGGHYGFQGRQGAKARPVEPDAKAQGVKGAKIPMRDFSEFNPPAYTQTRSIKVDPDTLVNRKILSIVEKNEVGDQYKLLRTKVLNRTRPMGYNTIEISSFREGDGKSLTSVNLAVTLAKETRQNVLLVDADLRRPTIHTFFGLDPSPGLRDHFVNGTSIESIMVHPGIERLTLLPAGGRMDNSTEVLGSHRMEALVEELKHRYPDRYILFDAPALCTCSDPVVLSGYIDAMVLVVRAGHTTTEDIKSGLEIIGEANVLGIVLNDTKIRRGWAY
jgi:non-specific protein-tyrosine kinase